MFFLILRIRPQKNSIPLKIKIMCHNPLLYINYFQSQCDIIKNKFDSGAIAVVEDRLYKLYFLGQHTYYTQSHSYTSNERSKIGAEFGIISNCVHNNKY